MKFLLIAVCTFACAYASAVSDAVAAVVRSDIHQSPEGEFHYVYETENGITGNAEGKLKSLGKDEIALEVVGVNNYVGDDGQKYEISYVANENGYQPQGAHLPTTPAPVPIPDYIARAIEYIASHPHYEEKESVRAVSSLVG